MRSQGWGRRTQRLRSVLASATAAAAIGCGSGGAATAVDAGGEGDAAPVRTATGQRLVDHAAVIGGITSDGYVAFSDVDGNGHSVAKVMPIDGSEPETVIATSAGTGKADVRFEIHGGVVFAWTDRGNRTATLAVWSHAAGAVALGAGIRPGRAAATSDGRLIAYERDITATTVNVVAGPIAGPPAMLAPANAEDDDCWRDTDLAAIGTAAPRLLLRYCPAGATAFALRSIAADGTAQDLSSDAAEAVYGTGRAIWRETGGAIAATTDGIAAVPLASGSAELAVTRDLTHLAYRTADGAVFALPSDGSAAAHQIVAAPAALRLGAISPDGQTVLYATATEDRGGDNVAPYTDVRAASATGTHALVTGTTSCPACLADSFTPDGRYALVLDPIDNSQAADGAGPIKVFSLDDGSAVTSFGTAFYTAIAIGGAGTASRFVFVDAVRDASLVTGWRYGLVSRSLAVEDTAELARGAENFAIDRSHARAVISFGGDDGAAGLWLVALE